MKNNIISINGEQLLYRNVSLGGVTQDRLENLKGIEYAIRANKVGSMLSNFRSITVPNGFYFALGDNRDNSSDLRLIGLVPRSEIVGRSRSVVMSLNYDNYYIPRKDRFFHVL